jgi:hypothetical protein
VAGVLVAFETYHFFPASSAAALAFDAIGLRAAALLLLLAVILGTINAVRIVRHAFAVLPRR